MDATNLQPTFEMCIILRRPHSEPVYDHRKFLPTNGVNFNGSPHQFPFTPKETWQARCSRESFDTDFYCMDHARKQNLLELMTLLGDTCVGNCLTLRSEKVRLSEPLPVGACRYCGSIISVACYECPACNCSFQSIDGINIDQHKDITRTVRVLWHEAPNG